MEQDDEEDGIEQVIRKMVLLRGAGNTVSAEDVARRVAAKQGKSWRPLLKPVREAAIRMAREGQIVVSKKGKTVDPDSLKGAYRLALPAKAAPCGPCGAAESASDGEDE